MKKENKKHRKNRHATTKQNIMKEKDAMDYKQDNEPSEHPAVAERCRELGCKLLNVEVRHKLNPDTFWIPEVRVRQRLYPGCRAKVFFKANSPGEAMWVEIWAVREDGLYVGQLRNTPLFYYQYLHQASQVVFAAHHVCAVDLLDGRAVGTLDELPSPDAELVDLTGHIHPCAGCYVESPLCIRCAAIRALKTCSGSLATEKEDMSSMVNLPSHMNPAPSGRHNAVNPII